MIARLVSFALRQPFLIVVAALALMAWGAWSFQNLPIDAYPDLSPPHVELITQWPGHASEEMERLVTIPLEIELNGIPRLDSLRSISLYGLSFIAMNFEYGADPYFVREQAFERMADAQLPAGLTPSLSPLFSPSGLIYRYVLQSPDRSPQELKTIEDWVLERHYRSIQGRGRRFRASAAPPCSTRCCSTPTSCSPTASPCRRSPSSSAATTPIPAAASIPRAGSSITSAAWAWCATRRTSATSSCSEKNGIPVYVKDLAQGADRLRAAPRPVRLHEARTKPWKASS